MPDSALTEMTPSVMKIMVELAHSKQRIPVYSRHPGFRKQMAGVIEGLASGGFNEPMLRLALEDLPLTASTNAPDYCQDALNRHGVLHGTDTDYPSRLNSFRALSLLHYAALFEEAVRWCDRKNNKAQEGVAPND